MEIKAQYPYIQSEEGQPWQEQKAQHGKDGSTVNPSRSSGCEIEDKHKLQTCNINREKQKQYTTKDIDVLTMKEE
jgi:hypothetical protein